AGMISVPPHVEFGLITGVKDPSVDIASPDLINSNQSSEAVSFQNPYIFFESGQGIRADLPGIATQLIPILPTTSSRQNSALDAIGYEGSALENSVLEEITGVEAIS